MNHAYDRRVLRERPRLPLVENKRSAPGAAELVRFFTGDEKVRFLQYARPDVADLFQLGVLTGIRPAEMFHLRVDAIDLPGKKTWVRACACERCPDGKWIPKTGRYRAIDIADDLDRILRRLINGKPDDALVIENRHGAPFARLEGSGGAFIKTLRRAGLDRQGLSLYSTRHTFASDLISAGKPMKEIADLLGNGVRTCELHYAKLQPGVTRETVKVLRATRPWPTAPPVPTKTHDVQTSAEDL